MRDRTFVIMLTLVALAALSVSALGVDIKMTSGQTCITPSQEDLELNLRELWAEHVIWDAAVHNERCRQYL